MHDPVAAFEKANEDVRPNFVEPAERPACT
jgi:hypothetical protein